MPLKSKIKKSHPAKHWMAFIKREIQTKNNTGTAGFEPVISAVTGQCAEPDYTTSPKNISLHYTIRDKLCQMGDKLSFSF